MVTPAPSPAADRLGALDRMRLAAISGAIALLVFSQSSGLLAADTKLDLVVDPGRFLRRAMTLWDPDGASGQLQDQAYGYLFPMGPFFAVGKLISLDPWMLQRCWESAILIVAFLGARRLASLLGVPGFWPCVCAGAVYALAPRMLTELFSISSELLPVAVLPLVLIPLVRGSTAGSPRVAAARSGLALLLAGGINASATLAILPVPALWLLSRGRGPRRAALIRWWALAVPLACLWWLVPLLVLGRYSPPFLNWIESSAVTTSQNSFIAIARGADHWQAYLGPRVWPAGWIYAVAPAVIVATAAVAAAGFGGLALRRTPHRLFLAGCLLAGFVLLSMGHLSAIQSPLAEPARQLLDGPLSAFRNIHKFDPMVRLPLAIGAGHLVAAAIPRVRSAAGRLLSGPQRWEAPFVTTMVLASVFAVALTPAISNQLVQQPRGTALAGYWPQTAQWLREHAGTGRALVVPGAGRPEMVWGSTVDEPLQPAAESPWAIRETVPLGQAGYVRFLDAVEELIATGVPQPSLAPLLTRAGIGYLVVRADLLPTADATDLGLVLSTVLHSPGLSAVASFGPPVRRATASNRLVDGGIANDVPAIQILQVGGGAAKVDLLDAEHPVLANGSAEQLPALVGAGLPARTPVLFGADAGPVQASAPVRVLTDGLRKRELQFGHPGQVAATLAADQPYQATRVAHDYLPDDAGPLSAYGYSGIVDVRASSAGSDSAALVNRGPEHAPWYALDGDPATAWLSGSADGAVGQWWEVRLTAPLADPVVTIRFPEQLQDFPTALTVRTDAGSQTVAVTPDAQPQRLSVPAGVTQRLRLTVAALASGTSGVATGLAGVTIAGVQPRRSLVVADQVDADVLSFRAAPGYRTGCAALASASACVPALARTGEEQDAISRAFTVTGGGRYAVSASVVPVAGAALNRELDRGAPVTVKASSTASTSSTETTETTESTEAGDPRQRPGAVVDGLPGTTWSAAPDDPRPTLTLRWAAAAPISAVVLRTAADAPVSTAATVRVSAAGRSWELQTDDAGELRLPRTVLTDTVTLEILDSAIKVSTDEVTGATRILPVGIGEVQLVGGPQPRSRAELVIGCGQGPVLDIDGRLVRTSVRAPRAAVLAGAEVPVTVCGTSADRAVELAAGPHQLTFSSSATLAVQGVRLSRGTTLTATPALEGNVTAGQWGRSERTATVATQGRALLVVHENFNIGWRASLDGHRLPAVRVDGWQQAFLLPANAAGTVTLVYAPDRTFKAGLLGGLLAVLGLLGLALHRVPVRLRPPSWLRPLRRSPDPTDGRSSATGLPSLAGPPSLPDGQPSLLAGAGALLLLLTLLAGVAGLVGGLAAVALARRGLPNWLPVLAALTVLVAGVLNALGPSVAARPLTDRWATQALVLLALLTVATSALGALGRPAEPR